MLPAAWVSRGRIPLVFHAHNRLNQRYAAWMAGWTLRQSHATVIASCRFVAQPLLPFLDPQRTHIVYNGVADHGYRERSPNGPVRIGVIGRIAPEKGQRCFVDAAGLLAATRPDFRFVVIGRPLFGNPEADLYFERLREASAGLPVEFAGWTDDVAGALAGLDLLVVPSTGPEATTRVIPEAWSAGVPVLASESGGIAEIVEDGTTGFLVPPCSARALADRMGEVISLPKGRILAVTRAARQLYELRFTGQDYGAAICGLVARVLGQ
jgi:glycosyltransferase involved in cell wall biosynthesis